MTDPQHEHPFPSATGKPVAKPEWADDDPHHSARRITKAVEDWERENGRR
ncbi:hypothetical protein [Streptomyces sp. CS014]|nr:hypothetical protein [Streptomyces sp. CS014]